MALWIFRHSQTYDDIPGQERPSGWHDVTLTPEGVERANVTGKFAAAHTQIHNIISSDLPRAMQTAQIIASHLGAQVHPTPELRAWNMGVAAGRPQDSVKAMLNFYRRIHPERVIPGGEAFNTSVARFSHSFNQLLDFSRAHPHMDVGALTHSENTNMIPHILSGGREPITYGDYVPDAGVIKISQDSNGRFKAEPIVVNKGEAGA